jgi:hypothetical protein
MAFYAFLSAAAVIAIVVAGAVGAQEPPLPSTYFFPDSGEAMAAALLDPHISNETKQALARLIEARRWPVEYQDPKTKLIWLYRPGKPPMLEGVRPLNGEATR